MENKAPSKINPVKDTLVEIFQVMKECAQFVAKYSETTNFCTPIIPVYPNQTSFAIGRQLGRNVFSERATKVVNYNTRLDKLMQELRDRALFDVPYGLQQIREDLSLDFLACAGRVGLIKGKRCLYGTRIQILNEVVDWINNTDAIQREHCGGRIKSTGIEPHRKSCLWKIRRVTKDLALVEMLRKGVFYTYLLICY